MRRKTTFFKIDRKLLQSDLWLTEPFSKAQAWIDILGMASYEDHSYIVRGQLMTLKRGEIGTSEVRLAERWQWSREKVRRYLAQLEGMGNITLHKTALGTVISVENYTFYQGQNTADETADKTANETADETLIRNKEIKNNISLYAPEAQEAENLQAEFGAEFDGLVQDVRAYFEEHPEKRFTGWTREMRKFARNQKRWGGSQSAQSSRRYISPLDRIMAEEYEEDKA